MANFENNDSSSNKGKVRVKKNSTRVDMAPFCDLGFLLITFFMFTTTFSKPNMLNLNMPAKNEDQFPQEKAEIKLVNSITLLLGKDDKVYWYQEDESGLNVNTMHESDYSKDGIRNVLLTAKNKALDKDIFTVIIKPTDDSDYQNLVDILDEMKITKNSRYGITDLKPWELKIYNEKSGN